ncbi:MAG: CoA pyrophosphatase [Candidatus Heimdallarchaeota archaeon]|nr:CoA pyrophosphatase [Candidatus Heimdallarchaeota archaeon]
MIDQLSTWIEGNDRLVLGTPEAAVLVPIIEKDNIPHVILTKRSNNLRQHSGQIAFPGGKVDDEDENVFSTALRETEEEIGIPQDSISIHGLLDDFATPYFSSVTPVLGTIKNRDYIISESEIEEIFEVPLTDLMDPKIYHSELWQRDGVTHTIHFYLWHDIIEHKTYNIWGATAGVLFKVINIINSR